MQKKTFRVNCIFTAVVILLFSSCSFSDFQDRFSAGLSEDFENGEINERLFLYTAGESRAAVEFDGSNHYLSLNLDAGDYPDNLIILGYENCDATIPWGYTISYDLYIEQIDTTGKIAQRISTSYFLNHQPVNLEFYRNGTDYVYSAEWDWYYNYSYKDQVIFTPGQWIHVDIKTDTDKGEDPSYHIIRIAPYETQVRMFDALPFQCCFFEISGGVVKVRIDNLNIDVH